LKELEKENEWLRRAASDLTLDITVTSSTQPPRQLFLLELWLFL
jgi:hypothetical protein